MVRTSPLYVHGVCIVYVTDILWMQAIVYKTEVTLGDE